MKIGDLIEMRHAKHASIRGEIVRGPAKATGILIECVAPNARKVALWSVLLDDGFQDNIWSSDMKVISESR